MAQKSAAQGAFDLLKALDTANAGTILAGVKLSRGHLGEEDNTLAIMNSGGPGAMPSIALSLLSIQFMFRGISVKQTPTAYQLADDVMLRIENALLGIPVPQASWPELMGISWSSGIQDLGYDENFRPMKSLNMRVHIEPEQISPGNRQPL